MNFDYNRDNMIITIDNSIRIPLADLLPGAADEIKLRMAFKNPAYVEALGRLRAMGKSGRPGVPEVIRGWHQHHGQLILPRGVASDIIAMFPEAQIQNRTRRLPEVRFGFDGLLKDSQKPAVDAILVRRFGTIQSPTGSGKTVMGLFCIFARKQPALVVVHTTALLKQWVERAVQFLGVPEQEIGIIGQGSRTVGPRLTIALVQTLRKCVAEVAPKVGHIIVDECHHQAATVFTESVAPFDSAFALGLSATHKRRDGLTPLIYWYIGPLVYEVARSTLIRGGDIIHVEPVIRETDFEPSPDIDPVWQRAKLIQELTQDHKRNTMVAEDVVEEARSGPCIVLTDRREHAERLAQIINSIRWYRAGSKQPRAEACHGNIPKEAQAGMIQAMNDGRLQVLVATGQLLGEGFDCKQLTALFLATPIKFEGRLIQYLGRVARAAKGKTMAKVYDYVDVNVDVLVKAYRSRAREYKKLSRLANRPTPKEKNNDQTTG